MAHIKGTDKHDYLAEINMTPFVDIVLVLLVIFMITAPMMEARWDVELPATEEKTEAPPPKDFEVCTVTKEGKIEFKKKTFNAIDEFDAFLGKITLKSDVPIFIRADKKSLYGAVSQVLSVLRIHGYQQVSLVTEQVKRAK